MAKPLRQPPPSSSVAGLLDLSSAARAIATQPQQKPSPVNGRTRIQSSPHPETAAHAGETPHVKRQLVLTPSADQAFSSLVNLYQDATGTKLTASHIARAMLRGITHCFDQLERRARKLGVMKLPSNAKGCVLERERFEARIADAFVDGIRASSVINDDTSI